MKLKYILLLSGSHRGRKTTTNSILDYMENKLSHDSTIFREQVPFTLPDMQFVSRINDVLNECSTIVLCFPLYFDTLPYPLISILELLSNNNRHNNKINMFSIVHCGLPEAAHCCNAIDVCKCFSDKMGFRYSGSAIIPDTGAIEGASIEGLKRISSILDKSIDVLTCSSNVDNEIRFIGKPSMHPFFFRIFGNIIMKHFAKKNKVSVFQKGYDD